MPITITVCSGIVNEYKQYHTSWQCYLGAEVVSLVRRATTSHYGQVAIDIELISDGIADHLFLAWQPVEANRSTTGREMLPEVTTSKQILFFTHHRRLTEIAREVVGAGLHSLPALVISRTGEFVFDSRSDLGRCANKHHIPIGEKCCLDEVMCNAEPVQKSGILEHHPDARDLQARAGGQTKCIWNVCAINAATGDLVGPLGTRGSFRLREISSISSWRRVDRCGHADPLRPTPAPRHVPDRIR